MGKEGTWDFLLDGVSLQLLAVLGLYQTRHDCTHFGAQHECPRPTRGGGGGLQAAGPKEGGAEGGGLLPFLVWFSLQERSRIWPHSGQLIRPGVSFVDASAA